MKERNVVAIGGGTGLASLLRGLKQLPINLSAIVTMSDNGQSSGRLRRLYATLPPGDIRKCLIALSDDEEFLTKLFDYRFSKGRGLTGHSFGNLFLMALTDITGDFDHAVRESSRILAIKGKVLPSTLANIELAAKLSNGQVVVGEADITIMGHRSPIKKVFCVPDRVSANPEAVDVINSADLIIVGPGSLYTSLIPNILIPGIKKAILANKKARKIFVCNVSTERGETERYTVEDHIDKLLSYGGSELLTDCIVNNRVLRFNGRSYKLGVIHNITTDKRNYRGIRLHRSDVIDHTKPLNHDPAKLQKIISRLL